jgi:GPH family glycoside/pentoside/hexuronide:cation symporter
MYITFFYTDIFGISGKAVGIMFLVARLWDAINDPIMGSLVDKLNLKGGKYRPYLLYGIIPFLVLSILCFTVPDFAYFGKIVYAYATYILITMVYTFINIPYGALTSAMTRDQNETAKITSMRMLCANGGGVIIAFFVPFLAETFTKLLKYIVQIVNVTEILATENSVAEAMVSIQGAMEYANIFAIKHSYQGTMAVMGVIGCVLLYICWRSTKERVVPVSEEPIKFKDIAAQFKVNKPLIVLCVLFAVNFATFSINGAGGMYYVSYYLKDPSLVKWFNLVGPLLAVCLFPLVPAMVRSIGKKNFMYIGIGLNIIGTLGFYFTPASSIFLIFFWKFLTAVGGLTGGYAWALVPEAITYGEYKLGKRTGGIIYALIGFFFKLGMAVGGLLFGFMLDAFKYVPNQIEQSPEALKGILVLFSIIPVFLMIITLIVVKVYQLDDKKYAEIVSEVERRAAQAHHA